MTLIAFPQHRSKLNVMVYDDNTEYDLDIRFGQWLYNVRRALGLTLLQAQTLTSIPTRRLVELESGQGRKGLTKREAVLFSEAYRLDYDLIIDQLYDRIS